MTAAPILQRLEAIPKAVLRSQGWSSAPCPAHEDDRASFGWTVNPDGAVGLRCHAGCTSEAIVGSLGMSLADLYPPREGQLPLSLGPVVETYDYRDGEGNLVYQVTRHEPKTFRQRRPDGNGGWIHNLQGVERVLYRLPELRSAEPERMVLLTEGEKDVDRLVALGLVATTNAAGAGKWRDEYAAELAGRRVAILPDNDDPGRDHARTVAASLLAHGCEVRVVELPDLPPKGDVSDWLDAGGDAATLKRLVLDTPVSEPEPPASPWPEPEDRGTATLSAVGDVEYADDLIRPGRILVVAAEEGTGKSYAITGELGIRVAAAGGAFAGTWNVVRNGPVLVLSEMHTDDDFAREDAILSALELERSALTGRYYRLNLMTAARGAPVLTVPEWRSWFTSWARERGLLLMVVDTATGATLVDPWGKSIQQVYADLRVMLNEYPDLAVILLVHCKKPNGRGERGLSDVLGEWGRWCDVVLMMENDGGSLERVKLTARKRVRQERRIVVTKRGGLLVDPVDITAGSTTKVPTADVVAAVKAKQGMTYDELGKALGVSKDTATRYVKALPDDLDTAATGPRGANLVFLRTAAPPQTAA